MSHGSVEPRISVLVPGGLPDVARTLTSLDRQTLPPSEVDVVVCDDGSDLAWSRRAQLLARHRPNVRIVEGRTLQRALDSARGTYVALVPAGRTVQPGGLERLCDLADGTQAGTCVGLTGTPGPDPRPDAVAGEDAVVDADDPRVAGSAGRIHRRSLLEGLGAGSATTDAFDRAVTARAGLVAAVGSLPCFVDPPAPGGAGARPSPLRATSVRWESGVARVGVELPGGTDPAGCSVALRSASTGVSWPVPAGDVEVGAGAARLAVRLDPGVLAAGGPLPRGTWWPTVSVDDRGPRLLRARPSVALGGSAGERLLVSFSDDGLLGIDCDATRHELNVRIDPDACVLTESHRGTLLEARCLHLDLTGEEPVEGRLLLGNLPVPARLRRDASGHVVLTAWMTGVEGRYRLAADFSPRGPSGCRVDLVVDAVGRMRIEPRERAGGSDQPAPPPAPRTGGTEGGGPAPSRAAGADRPALASAARRVVRRLRPR